MLDVIDYNSLKRIIHNSEIKNDTIGILFTRPELETGKSILGSLNFYHHMSGESINFFLPGYSAYTDSVYKDNVPVVSIDDVPWSFSVEHFVNFVNDMQKYSKWIYSGESDLLLVEYENNLLCFDRTMDLKLDLMLKEGVIHSVPSFFQSLFFYSQEHDINKIRNRELFRGGMQLTIGTIKQALPNALGKGVDIARYYSVENLSK